MQRTLDREMPQKRKRRFLIWIFLGAATVAGILAQQRWRSAQPVLRPQPPEKTAAPVPRVAAAPSVGRPTASETIGSSASDPKKPAPARQPVAAAMPEAQVGMPELPVADPPANESGAFNQSAPIAGAPVLFLPARELPDQVVSRQPVSSSLRPAAPPPIYPVKKSGSRKLQPGMYAAARLNPVSGSLSPSAGVLADWRWSGKFGLRAGAGYQYERFSRANTPSILLTETVYSSLTGDDRVLENNVFSGVAVAGNVLVPIASLHRLEIPLQLYWQAHPRWRAYAGVQWQYTFLASGNGSVVELDSSRVLTLPIGESNRLAGARTRGWTSYLSLGLSHAFSKRMELALQYQSRPQIRAGNRLDANPSALADQIAQYTRKPYDRQAAAIRQFQLQAVWKF
ncbi:MAG: hypothetical protein RL742_142 [Bacteroidota bacterium]|jgi:hypothetical protein